MTYAPTIFHDFKVLCLINNLKGIFQAKASLIQYAKYHLITQQ